MDQVSSRRLFLKRAISAVVLLAGGVALLIAYLSKKAKPGNRTQGDSANPCDDSFLGKDDLKARESMGYVKKSPVSSKQCGGCKLFLPVPVSKTCGRCQLFKGPVAITGNCSYWVPQI